ncbi:MAG: oligosaccharide flippase family protein, partial [Candidatus Latescibacterota bacterium]
MGASLRYAFLAAAGTRAVSFAADVGLMRLLEVRAFGALAFGLLVVNALGLARSLGVGEALIWRRRAEQETCDAAFVLSVVLGVALCAAVVVTAPWVARLAGEGDRETVTRVLRLLSLAVVLQGVAGVPTALLERALDFRSRLWVDLLPALTYAAAGLGLAAGGWGVWSLVWARLAAAGVGAA